MNENETDPRPGQGEAERGQAEPPTAAQPPVAAHAGAAAQPAGLEGLGFSAQAGGQPASNAPQWGAPVSGAPQSGQPWPQPQHPQQQTWQQPHSPWQQPGYHHQAYQQQQYAQQAGYAAWAQPGSQAHTEGQPGQGQPGQGQPGQGQPGQGQPGQGQPGQQAWGQPGATDGHGWPPAEGQQPAWAQPVGGPPPAPGRGRKTLVAGAAAVLIALVAGGVGAATALAFDGDGSSPTVQTGNSSVTRVVDRSSLAQIAAAVQDSVVSITTGSGEGSGVVLTADGFIVTNNHVVASAQGSSVTVIFADGQKAQASIVGTDERTDLAVIKATGVSDLQAAKFGTSAKMEVGDTVLAIGSPLGLEGSVTAGILSAKDRTIQSGGGSDGSPFGNQSAPTTMSGLLQTDAPINPGNSGGALVNTNGEVIGINSAIATGGQGSGNIGLGFAIPSDKAKLVAEDLMAGRKVSHPALGVSVTDAENGGALVKSVTPESAAAKAGLQQGDVVTQVDGKAIDGSNDLVAAVQQGKVGQQMTLDYTRDGAKKQVTATLTEAK
ncbi:S1C family serine protease [Paractinoplanes rishiriensis]|uniref:PDZ domain-containing protein n=1 Tax=Paractinoplanes rishiriensis TaxID=1050105 RepID=A0A919JUQ0_9ACTN|nr:trypsin-like peptidase domain-containing protein [Actinoplanes rishiriensis]GIE93985.1 hypothetical protein Ari01nite_14500 [Actinoplanes rishiriensis]